MWLLGFILLMFITLSVVISAFAMAALVLSGRISREEERRNTFRQARATPTADVMAKTIGSTCAPPRPEGSENHKVPLPVIPDDVMDASLQVLAAYNPEWDSTVNLVRRLAAILMPRRVRQ